MGLFYVLWLVKGAKKCDYVNFNESYFMEILCIITGIRNVRCNEEKHSSIPMACNRTLLFNGNSCIHMLLLCSLTMLFYGFSDIVILSSAIWVKIVKCIIKYFFFKFVIICGLPLAF